MIKPPLDSIDWSFVGFQGWDETSHIESVWSADTEEWSAPKLVKDPMVKVHGLSPGLNYGQQCYEGMRACRGKDNQIYIFRPDEHAERMRHSATVVSIPPVPDDVFTKCIHAAVYANTEFVPPFDSNAGLYIRPLLFGSGGQLMLSPPSEFKFCVFVQPGTLMYGKTAIDVLVLDDFDRTAPRGVGHAKLGGNYGPTMRWSQLARDEGFDLTLQLDGATHTEIEEYSNSAFGAIKVNGAHTTFILPKSRSILQSVTAQCCMEIAADLGWKVEKRVIKWDEVNFFDEVFAMGTATILTPVQSITRPSTKQVIRLPGDAGAPGSRVRQLREKLLTVVFAHDPQYRGWSKPLQPILAENDDRNRTHVVSEEGSSSVEYEVKSRL